MSLNVFITGATGGIGSGLARVYAAKGATLGLVAHHQDALDRLIASLPGTGHKGYVADANRFQDESGQPVPFKIRALTQEENDAITRQATRRRKEGGQTIEQLDSVDFTRRMVVAATVEPDFSSKELCDGCGVLDPLLVPGKLLLSGEYARLVKEITKLSGFAEQEDEVKN